jgi:UDP-glucuronate decarboxylase
MSSNDGRVVSNFIDQALNNEDITIYGDGSQTRSFQYVDDLITGLIAVMNSNIKTPINIGNPSEFTILALAKLVIKLTGSHSNIIFLTLPQDDPRQRCPDITLARELLNWQPTVNLVDGLNKTIEYFRIENGSNK